MSSGIPDVDLTIDSVECSHQSVYVHIRNKGTMGVSGFHVVLYINPAEGYEDNFIVSQVLNMTGHQTIVCNITHNQYGELMYYCIVDRYEEIVETDEGNNEYGPIYHTVQESFQGPFRVNEWWNQDRFSLSQYYTIIGPPVVRLDDDDILPSPITPVPPIIPSPPSGEIAPPPPPPEFPHPPIDDDSSTVLPDLVILDFRIWDDIIYVEIQNKGRQDIRRNFRVDLFINPLEQPGYGDFSTIFDYSEGLGSGEKGIMTFDYHFDLKITSLYAIVDSNQDVLESEESNNIKGKSFNESGDDGPDIIYSWVSGEEPTIDSTENEELASGPGWIPVPQPPSLPITD
jgi:hypothetical protein